MPSPSLHQIDREVPLADPPSLRRRPGSESFHSPAYLRALRQLERFARHDHVVVLLEGEPGTGKTTLARQLHEQSPRRERSFHRVDLGALDDELSASDLFGHAAGAFTGATGRRHGHVVSADRGTLFLDEIGKASLTVQRKLLHLVECGELTAVGTDRSITVNVRIVAATNVSLAHLVDSGTFLPDLLQRFGFFRVNIPPLRERRQDIESLAASIIAAQAPRFGYGGDRIPELHMELVEALVEHSWPGNVRELASALQYVLANADGATQLTLDHCDGTLAFLAERSTPAERAHRAVTTAGSKAAAARQLGIARTTLDRHLREVASPEGRRPDAQSARRSGWAETGS